VSAVPVVVAIAALGALALFSGSASAAPRRRVLVRRPPPLPPLPDGSAAPDLDPVVVYLHGFGVHVENLGPLLDKLTEGNRATVVVPQLGPKSEVGDLDLPSLLQEHNLPDHNVALLAHSGGYSAAASLLQSSTIPIRAVALFDALYGRTALFEAFAKTPGKRFFDIYGSSTAPLSNLLGQRLLAWAKGQGQTDVAFDPNGTGPVNTLLASRVAIFWTKAAHAAVPGVYGGAVVRALEQG